MKLKSFLTVFALTASLSLFGCKDGHDHDHDHGPGHEHEHGEKGEQKEGADKAGAPAADTNAAPSTNAAASTVASNAKPYPLETCIVAGSKLGSMGEPFVLVHEGQEVKFCCESCKPKFDADPAKYLAKLTTDAKPEPAAN